MPKNLKLECAVEVGDFLTVREDIASKVGNPAVQLTLSEGKQSTHLFLDENDARRLFNWLGLWLHGA